MKKIWISIKVLVTLMLLVRPSMALPNAGNDALIEKSSLVVVAQVTSEPSCIASARGGIDYRFNIKVEEILMSKFSRPLSISDEFQVSLLRNEWPTGQESDLIRKGGLCLLFLKSAGDDFSYHLQGADQKLSCQQYDEATARKIKQAEVTKAGLLFRQKKGKYRVGEYWRIFNQLFASHGDGAFFFPNFVPQESLTEQQLNQIFGDGQSFESRRFYALGVKNGIDHSAEFQVVNGQVKSTRFSRMSIMPRPSITTKPHASSKKPGFILRPKSQP